MKNTKNLGLKTEALALIIVNVDVRGLPGGILEGSAVATLEFAPGVKRKLEIAPA